MREPDATLTPSIFVSGFLTGVQESQGGLFLGDGANLLEVMGFLSLGKLVIYAKNKMSDGEQE